MRRSFSALVAVYWLVALPLMLVLILEVALVVERRWWERELENQRGENPFQAREVSEAVHESLWETQWEYYRKGAEARVALGEVEHHVQINSLGFRTGEFSVDKPPGRIRIICIGGSTTVQGRTNADTYPARLERLLRKRFPGVDLEVLNFGISGTTSDYWLKAKHDLFKYSPDIIVQYNGINDIAWRYFREMANQHPWRKSLNRSHLAQRLFPMDPRSMDPLLARTIANFARLNQQATEHGADYVVGSFAVAPFDASPSDFQHLLDINATDAWGRAISLKTYRQLEALIIRFNELFQALARKYDIDTVLVHKKIRDPALFIDACHMTPTGIEALARAFRPAVSRRIKALLGS